MFRERREPSSDCAQKVTSLPFFSDVNKKVAGDPAGLFSNVFTVFLSERAIIPRLHQQKRLHFSRTASSYTRLAFIWPRRQQSSL